MNQSQIRTRSLRQWLRRNPHAWWALLLIPMLCFYFLPEQLVVTGYHATQTALDARIPFVPWFIYFYVLWFFMLAATGVWLMLRDGRGFREYMWFLTAAYFICCVIYLCFPNGQDLRPAITGADSLATRILTLLYGFDTNTNVLPSLHVIGSIGVALCVCGTPSIRFRTVKAATVVLAVLVSVSTVFVKQHAVLDVAAGIVVGFGLYALVHRLCRKI